MLELAWFQVLVVNNNWIDWQAKPFFNQGQYQFSPKKDTTKTRDLYYINDKLFFDKLLI